jgi:hypothetical protein
MSFAFAATVILALRVPFALAGQEVKASPGACDNVESGASVTFGGNIYNGQYFCAAQVDANNPISGLKFWDEAYQYNYPGINGMQVLFWNGDWISIGKLEGRYSELFWDPKESSIKDVTAFPNFTCGGDHDRCGGAPQPLEVFRLILTDGRSMVAGIQDGDERQSSMLPSSGNTTFSGSPVAFSGFLGDKGIEQIGIKVSAK